MAVAFLTPTLRDECVSCSNFMKKYNSVHDDELNKVIGKNIRKIRKENDYSSIMLCSELGISFSTLSNIERGVHATKLIHLDKMAELFEVSRDVFFHRG